MIPKVFNILINKIDYEHDTGRRGTLKNNDKFSEFVL